MAKKRPAPTREDALKVARYLGCSGAHQDESGTWFPCANAETMNRISSEAEPKSAERRKRGKRRRFVQDGYEPLGSRGVLGIDTIPGVGLVSGKTVIIGRAQPRRGDPDVYDDPNAARLRSRALGCIGIARRATPDGEVVWTPCTNVSDFRRVTGQSVLGQREESRRFARRLREVGGPALTRRRTRGKAFDSSLKALTTIGQLNGQQTKPNQQAQRGSSSSPSYDPNARDADGDGTVQEGTEFARSANSQRSRRRTGSADTAERRIERRQKKPKTPPPPANPVQIGNIDLSKRKPVELADGSQATIRSISVNIEGLEILIPTIGPNGEDWDPDTDKGLDAAIEHYFQTGQHLGKFKTVDEAVAYGDWLHDREAERIALPGKSKSAEAGFFSHQEEKAAIYTKPELRERIKDRIMAGSRGGKPGQWSARKAQLLAIEYRRAGGGYRGEKKKPQRSLDKWTREEWTTSDGKPAIRKGGTTRYLPKKAWEKLTPAQRAATNRKKRTASVTGAQFVANTERAREAGRAARNSSKGAYSPETSSGRIDRVKRRF